GKPDRRGELNDRLGNRRSLQGVQGSRCVLAVTVTEAALVDLGGRSTACDQQGRHDRCGDERCAPPKPRGCRRSSLRRTAHTPEEDWPGLDGMFFRIGVISVTSRPLPWIERSGSEVCIVIVT